MLLVCEIPLLLFFFFFLVLLKRKCISFDICMDVRYSFVHVGLLCELMVSIFYSIFVFLDFFLGNAVFGSVETRMFIVEQSHCL